MFNIVFCIVSLFSLLEAHVTTRNYEHIEPLSDEMISFINQHPNAGWKADRSDRFHSLDDSRILLGGRKEDPDLRRKRRPTVDHHDLKVEIPSHFDARKKWPRCKNISQIRDQSQCGSSWAVSAVGAMSDRICIQSRGQQSVELSAIDLISCCENCGSGCGGGFLGPSWDYWVTHGIVTGGSKENHTGCRPYPFSKCDHFIKGKYRACGTKLYDTPQCNQTCQKGYKSSYKRDKHYGKTSYNVIGNEEDIRKEIMMYGPVEAFLDIFEDFLNYKSGIYRYIAGKFISGHAVRLIGWGVENGTPYWLAANTWNEDWGEKGYFRILRGQNECSIESEIAAGRIKS